MKKKKDKVSSSDLITITILIILLIGTLILLIQNITNAPNTFEEKAETYCDQENINSVEICNNQMIEIKSSLLGGGSKFIHRDGTTFTCPVVSPDSMSPDCKAINNAKSSGQWNCVDVC